MKRIDFLKRSVAAILPVRTRCTCCSFGHDLEPHFNSNVVNALLREFLQQREYEDLAKLVNGEPRLDNSFQVGGEQANVLSCFSLNRFFELLETVVKD